MSLDEIRERPGLAAENRTPTKRDWERLSNSWRPRLDAQIALLERLRDRLTGCIGCGCLSLRACRLLNPDDQAARFGPGSSLDHPGRLDPRPGNDRVLTVYSDDHRLHRARHELIDGRLAPAWETPERAEAVLARVREVGMGDVIAPDDDPDGGLAAIARVHDGRFLDFLAGAWEAWEREGRDWEALPLAWPTRHLRQIEPETIDGKLSYFSFDAGTPITAGTWAAATASARVA